MTATYASEYGASRPLTAAQKLAEMACSRRAAATGRAIGPRFWDDASWGATFSAQLRAANRLLKLYDPAAVFAALRDDPRAYSLGTPFFAERVDAAQVAMDNATRRAADAPVIEARDAESAPRGGPSRPSTRGKLKGL